MTPETKNITVIILAGGKSSRMGKDKGMMDLNGKKMIEYVILAAREITGNILIVANNEDYKSLGYTAYRDLILNAGPAGGIYTGLYYSPTEKNLVLSCDIPNINGKMLQHLLSLSGEEDIAVPVTGEKPEPLCAVYSKNVGDKLPGLILKGERTLQEILKKFNTRYHPLPEEAGFEANLLFRNINTPDELEEQKKMIAHEN